MVFSWSYDALSASAATLFRLLALHPGPDLTAAAAASLAGIPVRQARTLLAELDRVHLVDEVVPGRYAFHDLLFAYAAELAHTHDPDRERRAARHRILDHYLHTAHAASQLISTPGDPVVLAPAEHGVTPESLGDLEQALAWLTAERPVLLAMIQLAVSTGFGTHAWQLAWCITAYLNRRGHWPALASAQRTALHAARQQDDLGGQARSHLGLGFAYGKLAASTTPTGSSGPRWTCVLGSASAPCKPTRTASPQTSLTSRLARRKRFATATRASPSTGNRLPAWSGYRAGQRGLVSLSAGQLPAGS
jgi:hypothetical protein